MPDKTFLHWPFFDERHRALAAGIESWCASNLSCACGGADDSAHGDLDAACRDLVRHLGRDGWLSHTAPDPESTAPLDVRTLCLIRETLAQHDALADFAFAMQGLGAGPISLFGNVEQRRWLARTRSGEAIAAFALTEQQSGSDVANIAMAARRDGNGYVLDGKKPRSRTAASPISMSYLPAPAEPRAQRGFQRSSCPAMRRDFLSPSASM